MNLSKLIEQKKKEKAKKEKAKVAKNLALGATIGVAAGLASGLLFAPKSGKDTRQSLKKTANDLNNTIKSKAIDVTEDAKSNFSDAKSKIAKYLESKKAITSDSLEESSKEMTAESGNNIEENSNI
ncbi:YtxH domain-containing protein [Clostridium sp.]|uniref:YtxH domain-containing protein n=1 Tax=Clostridium sp. TaxID=1506 RepID=UPI00290E31AF|nr:YtxH domain-containing protein [Clostridium sp.]MDU3406444.1 YtxH domain-containing protein [Clostridium sp.]MDU7947722.1 YtxH domain-containing protein [Clostridium sp.]